MYQMQSSSRSCIGVRDRSRVLSMILYMACSELEFESIHYKCISSGFQPYLAQEPGPDLGCYPRMDPNWSQGRMHYKCNSYGFQTAARARLQGSEQTAVCELNDRSGKLITDICLFGWSVTKDRSVY